MKGHVKTSRWLGRLAGGALPVWGMSLVFAFGCGFTTSPDRPDVRTLDAGLAIAADMAQPPDAAEAWEEVVLPDLWIHERPGYEGSLWYRFEVSGLGPERSGNPARLGVYLPKVAMNAAVFVNGRWIGDGGSFERPVAQNWNRPLYFPFDASLLRGGSDVIHVRVFGYAHDWGALYPIQVGPDEVLRERAGSRFLWQITAAKVASLLSFLLAVVLGLLALGRRNTIYGFWALGSLAYFVHSLSAHIVDLPLPYPVGRWLIHEGFDLQAMLFVFSIHRWAGQEKRRLERALAGLWVLGAVLLAVVPRANGALFLPIANTQHLLTMVVAAYGGWTIWEHRQRLGREARIVALGLGAVLAVGAHALMVYLGVLPQDTPRLLTFIAPLMIATFGGVLIVHHIRAAKAADSLNEVLREKVAEKEAQLRRHFQRIQKLEAERVLSGERARLMQEMHDGMGGELISLLSTIEAEQASPGLLKNKVHGLIDEMRVIVDSLDPDIEEVGVLLGMLRERLEPGLAAKGMSFVWKVGLLPEEHHLRPEEALDLLRILQEAIANIAKHSQAKEVMLETHHNAEVLEIVVRDDGVGFEKGRVGGRGLKNMQRRAERLGATLAIDGSGEGTVLRLGLPLGRSD